MFKITSRFYVIYGDGIPIYVGYTNRTVKQRFREHKEDKDFSDYEVRVEELKEEKLVYEFTWDYSQTCKNADEVSLREGRLVQKYNTQNSIYQKADAGGQTWASEKWFVKSNKDNPKFRGMSGTQIKGRIKTEKEVQVDIGSFVNHMQPQYQTDIGNFVNNMKPQYQTDIGSFVNHMQPQYQVDIDSFVSRMKPQYQTDIGNFVNNMKYQYQKDIQDFVSNMKPQYQTDIGNFVNNMKYQYQTDIQDFVSHMKPQYQTDIGNFVNNMKERK
ncbi:hypothetical protein HWC08_gp094 [Lactobacillus phage 521B]|uniref:GIY-YIG domain-containing protein n=1 Tax=Lactobacillus phage 521B TaxID=2510942 RepID=A0A4Y5FHG9_9CAUD|nr:hypothetical protein HWC08_gp094 [Lactobacillus phage 521B]QBJ03444.1 hypothetical protein B521_0094 [Lactobacillus phage 521B]